MSEAAWLGLDLGTQSVRALAVARDGTVAGSGARRLRGRREGPRHEQDPDAWWSAVTAACREALADGAGTTVEAVAGCCTSGTIAMVDERGAPVTAGLMYDDARAAEEAVEVEERGRAVWASLGYRMQPSWALPKLVWLVRHGGLPAGARLAHQSDVVTERLVGRAVPADASAALKTGYDVLRERWPGEVLDALGVPASLLPDVVPAGTPLGTVCAEAAEATGIRAGAQVIAGMTDGCAAQLAAGAIEEGRWNSVLGTTLVVKGMTRELVRDPAGVVYSHRGPDGGWLPGGASSTGAGAVAAQFGDRDLDALTDAAREHEPAGAVAYPLVARGERFPFAAPAAEGFVLGAPADDGDRFAAVLQGVAFVERLSFDALDALGAPADGELRLTGGGARNRYWCQLRADVLRRPVALPDTAEPAFGMALLAAAASTGSPVAAVAAELVRVREVLEPRADRVARFAEPYVRLVDELADRGWLPEPLARHARERAAT